MEELRRTGFWGILTAAVPEFGEKEDFRPLDLELLEVEFARLFVGPGPHSPPYASIYREDSDRPGQLWSRTTAEVGRFMAHYGLEFDRPGTIPDHISVLFEFMERVLRAKIDASRRGDEQACEEADRIQRRFFLDYLAPWIEPFLERVQQARPLPFYAAVASFTQQFIAQERASAESRRQDRWMSRLQQEGKPGFLT